MSLGLNITRWLAAVFAMLIALTAYRFLLLDMELAYPGMLAHLAERRTVLMAHIVAAPLALAIGVFQLWPSLRARRPALHRAMGRIYVLAVLVAALAGLVIGYTAPGGAVAQAGFVVLALLWLCTTGLALWHIRSRRIAAHRRLMVRSYALTFAAVTLRLQLPFFEMFAGMDYELASNWVAWSAWLPNLIFAEWWLRRR
tara:strand:+ start:760 stop:1356 length:597 start_codon:yes stop_codon:yes gene_type:complete